MSSVSGAAAYSADRHRDSLRLGQTWGELDPPAVQLGLLLCFQSEFRGEYHGAEESGLLLHILMHLLVSFNILKRIMIECPSVTFPGVGLQGSRLGEPHAAPHIHPCAIVSAGMNDICGPVYDKTCIPFQYVSCIFCTLIYSWCLPMVSSTLFFNKKKHFLKWKNGVKWVLKH